MEFVSDKFRWSMDSEGCWISIRHPDKEEAQKFVSSVVKSQTIIIKQHRKKRSLDANSYLWVLCQKISEVLHSTKEEIYIRHIRDVGQFEILPIREDAVETWIRNWNSRGLGWVAELQDDSKLQGYKRVINYYGSSVYDTREMSVLVDSVVQEAKEQGIDTMTPDEIERLKSEWGNAK